jgi:hypothetical protein
MNIAPSVKNRRTPAASIDPGHAQRAAHNRQEKPALAARGTTNGNRGAWKIPFIAALPKRGEIVKSNKNQHKFRKTLGDLSPPRRTGRSRNSAKILYSNSNANTRR